MRKLEALSGPLAFFSNTHHWVVVSNSLSEYSIYDVPCTFLRMEGAWSWVKINIHFEFDSHDAPLVVLITKDVKYAKA